MLQVHTANDGELPFPTLLKRQKMYKDVNRVQGWSQEPDDSPDSYFREGDLGVGKTINVLGRSISLYDADKFTRGYYEKAFNTTFPPNLMAGQNKKEPPPKQEPPPYTGYGTEEDSLGSWKSLHPKVPKKDLMKLMNNSNKVLRFEADLLSKKPVDVGRHFVISFYLADDTLSVFEPYVINSGITAGRFLAREKHKNSDTGKYFTVEDIMPGKLVQLKGQVFQVKRMDEYTRRLLAGEEPTSQYDEEQLATVLDQIKLKILANAREITATFRRIDKDKNRMISVTPGG